jgi:carboxyl-terminal processing protease
MQKTGSIKRNLMGLVCLTTIIFSFAAYAGETAPPVSGEVALVEQACNLIDEGKFEAADGLIKRTTKDKPAELGPPVRQLSQITHDYEQIAAQRQAARQAAYAQALADLQKDREKIDLSHIGDANDANDLTSVFTVIAKASEFANETQKQQLLSDAFVKKVVQKAIDRAARLEVEGKWLEAYTNCYGWLVAIDPNNKGYSDYADRLLDKATLAMAFEDSPCETSEERFQGVQADMFVQAIDFLNSYYVTLIDYKQMAVKAIDRCKLLTEVIKTLSQQNPDMQSTDKSTSISMKIAWKPDELAAWSSTLDGLLDEVESPSAGLMGFGRSRFLQMFDRVLKLNKTTVDLPEPLLVSQFSEASLASLDPYTVIVWPRQVQDFEQMMTNEFSGIGIEISKVKGRLTVSSLLVDTPAFNSALDAGDVIEKVNGVPTKDMTLFCAAKKIKGPAGTKVKLTIRRPSEDKAVADKVFDITITRGTIVVPSVRGWQRAKDGKWLYMVDEKDKIGYVRLTSFSSDTALGLENALHELEGEGMKGLILDLRDNTGGLLDQAVAVVDKFVAEGTIVSRQPRAGQMAVYEEAHRRGTHPDYPLVVLTNDRSASASEIVAGALADPAHKRAILVGARTHGKGSVQGITGYVGKGAQLKYTMAYYHLPSGQRVESRDAAEKEGTKNWGVAPNVKVELRSDELKKMLEVQRQNDVLGKAEHEQTNDEFKKHTIQETLAADPQLAVGLLVLRSKLIKAEMPGQTQRINN